jgi:hypothetical protein
MAPSHIHVLAHAHRYAVDMQCAGYDSRRRTIERSIYLLRKYRRSGVPHIHDVEGLLCTFRSLYGGLGFESRRGQETLSRPAPGPTLTIPNWNWLSFPEVKRPGREVNPSQPYSDEVKNEWSYTSTPPICLNRVERELSTLLFTHL